MLHGILEEHKVHDGVNIIVFVQGKVEHLGKSVNTWELIVELLIKTTDEVGEDKGLRSSTEVFLKVELGEQLSSNLGGDISILSQVSSGNESITIDSFSLVYP